MVQLARSSCLMIFSDIFYLPDKYFRSFDLPGVFFGEIFLILFPVRWVILNYWTVRWLILNSYLPGGFADQLIKNVKICIIQSQKKWFYPSWSTTTKNEMGTVLNKEKSVSLILWECADNEKYRIHPNYGSVSWQSRKKKFRCSAVRNGVYLYRSLLT